MKHYTAKQINEIKQEIRTGKPVVIIADELAERWQRPLRGVYSKVLTLSKQTRKIKNGYTGPTRRPYASKRKLRPAIVQETLNFTPMPHSVLDRFSVNETEVIKEVCEDIMNLQEEDPIVQERQPAEIAIELPAGVMSFTGTPSKVVVYSDHVRYYFNN